MKTIISIMLCFLLTGFTKIQHYPVTKATMAYSLSLDSTQTLPPIKIVIIQDKTGSSNTNFTPQLTLDDLEPIVSLVRKRGGELAFGTIEENSNQPLSRFYIHPSPVPPDEPVLERNPFKAKETKAKYKIELSEYEANKTEWETNEKNAYKQFIDGIGEKVNLNPDVNKTDIGGAIQRAEHFLNEPVAGWTKQPVKVMVIISDAQDNVGSAKPKLKSGAHIVLINGALLAGDLDAYNPMKFESIESAFRHVEYLK